MKLNMRQALGVTLVELVIVIVIIGILAVAMGPLALQSLRTYNNTLGDVVLLDKLRYATERLAREIRAVDYVSGTGFSFTSMGVSSVAFTRTLYDAVGSGVQDTVTVGNTGVAVTMAYAKLPAAGAQVLTDELGSLSFTYLDQNGCAAGNVTPPCTGAAVFASGVSMVQIDLKLTHNGKDFPQRTLIQLKNIN
jgi:prepilin-type N-terminal cleavage/methylation domain-containing protein